MRIWGLGSQSSGSSGILFKTIRGLWGAQTVDHGVGQILTAQQTCHLDWRGHKVPILLDSPRASLASREAVAWDLADWLARARYLLPDLCQG